MARAVDVDGFAVSVGEWSSLPEANSGAEVEYAFVRRNVSRCDLA